MKEKKNFNKTLNNLSTAKKILLIGCLLLVLGSLYYLTFTERIVIYKENDIQVCNETYKVGKLISPMCPQNPSSPNYIPPEQRGFDGISQWNLTID